MARNNIEKYIGEFDADIDDLFPHLRAAIQQARQDDGRGDKHVKRRMRAWRYYIRRLVTEQPFLRKAVPGTLVSVNTGSKTCSAMVAGENGIIDNIKYYPPTKTPAVGQQHNVHFEVKLPTKTMDEDSKIEEGERWIKLYGGQFLYWTGANDDGLTIIYRINWPGSDTDEPEVVVAPVNQTMTVDTGNGATQETISAELLGVDGNGLMWVQYDVVSMWANSLQILNLRPNRSGRQLPLPPSNRLRAYKDYGKGDALPIVTLPPGYVARWADMTPGSSYISVERPLPAKVTYPATANGFSDWITVTAGGVTVNLDEHGRNTCLVYPPTKVYHERPYPALLDFNEGVCEYHVHWARNTLFTQRQVQDRTDHQFEMVQTGYGVVQARVTTNDDVLISTPIPTIITFLEDFITLHTFVLGFNYTGRVFGSTLSLVERPDGETEAHLAGIDGRADPGIEIELEHLGSEIENFQDIRALVNGFSIPRNRVWTDGEGPTAIVRLLAPWGKYDDPSTSTIGELVFNTPVGALGGGYTRDLSDLQPVRLVYRGTTSDTDGGSPLLYFMDWYSGGPDDEGNIRGFGRWHAQPPFTQVDLESDVIPRNDADSKVYWRHSKNDDGTGITDWEEFTEFEFGNHIAQDRNMDNILLSKKTETEDFDLYQTVDNGQHWKLTDWKGGRGKLPRMFNPPLGNAVIVDVN